MKATEIKPSPKVEKTSFNFKFNYNTPFIILKNNDADIITAMNSKFEHSDQMKIYNKLKLIPEDLMFTE